MPILRFGNVTMFDRVIMDVIQMTLKVPVVSNYVVPKSALPEAEIRGDLISLFEVVCEALLEREHDLGKAAPHWFQKKMEMIRQDDPGRQLKWIFLPGCLQHLLKQFNVLLTREVRNSIPGGSNNEYR